MKQEDRDALIRLVQERIDYYDGPAFEDYAEKIIDLKGQIETLRGRMTRKKGYQNDLRRLIQSLREG